MKLLLPITCLSASLLMSQSSAERKAPGPCMPYAEKCLHCSDCSQCKHCARDKGKCSVCWDK